MNEKHRHYLKHGGSYSETVDERVLACLVEHMDQWVPLQTLAKKGGTDALHSRIACLRDKGFVIRNYVRWENKVPDSRYMLLSQPSYDDWAAAGFPKVLGERARTKPRTTSRAEWLCGILNRVWPVLSESEARAAIKAVAPDASIEWTGTKLVPRRSENGER